MPSHQDRVRQNNCDHNYREVTIMIKTQIIFEGLECKHCGKRIVSEKSA